MVEYPIYIDKNRYCNYQPNNQGTHDMPAKRFQMIHKTHFRLTIFAGSAEFAQKAGFILYAGSQIVNY
jgi:hypothetical protein